MNKKRGIGYIAMKFSRRRSLAPLIFTVVKTLRSLNFEPVVFANSYTKQDGNNVEMMKEAFALIRKSKLLVAETSADSTGVGIELGYAKALRKPTVCLLESKAKKGSTVEGTVDSVIRYRTVGDINKELKKYLRTL